MKFGALTNSNILHLLTIFIFSVLDRKYYPFAGSVQKTKFTCLRWNLVLLLIEICCFRSVILFGSVVFIVNYGADSTHSYVSIDDFEQVYASWNMSEKIY